MPEIPAVFDTGHYAGTFTRKVRRGFELGPKYYLWDLPRYLVHRRRLGLPIMDAATLVNPFREFRSPRTTGELPSAYHAGLQEFARLGIVLTIPRGRLEALLAVWWSTRTIEGDDIECGSYRGATALLLAWLAHQHGIPRSIHLLDTFAGMPATSAFDAARSAGEFLPPADQVETIRRQAAALGVEERVQVHAGLFADTFPRLEAQRPRYAFAHIDANIYAGTRDACRYCLPRMRTGGAVIFDDYNGVCDLGARLAIDESLFGTGLKPAALTASSAVVRIRTGANS